MSLFGSAKSVPSLVVTSTSPARDLKQAKTCRLPMMWMGHLISIIYLSIWLVMGIAHKQPFASTRINFLLSWASWSFWIICVFRIHRVLRSATKGSYPITTTRAVVGMLIPVYNLLFWNFKWPAEIVRFVHKETPSRMARLWPGMLLFVATIAGPVAPPLRFLIAFSVASYLTKKIGDVLPESKPHPLPEFEAAKFRVRVREGFARVKQQLSKPHRLPGFEAAKFRVRVREGFARIEQQLADATEKQWQGAKLCVSAGVAAGFCFVIVQPAVPKFENVMKLNFEEIWRTSVEIAVVCLGVLSFLEPLCVRCRTWLGFPESRHKHASLKVKILLLGIVVASTLGHHLLDERASHEFGLTLFMLVSVTATTAVTTYAWMLGFLQKPRHAALFGFLAGLLGGYFFAFPLAQTPQDRIAAMDPVHPFTVLRYMIRPLKPLPLIESSLTSVPITYFNLWKLPLAPITTIAVVAPAVFGLAGGLVINQKGQRKLRIWNILKSFVIAGACLTAAVLLLIWLLPKQPSRETNPNFMLLSRQMLMGMIAAAVAWLAGLWIHGFTGSLAGRHPSNPRVEDPGESRRAAA